MSLKSQSANSARRGEIRAKRTTKQPMGANLPLPGSSATCYGAIRETKRCICSGGRHRRQVWSASQNGKNWALRSVATKRRCDEPTWQADDDAESREDADARRRGRAARAQ